MRLDDILLLRVGDTVYNCFMDKMTIKSIKYYFDDMAHETNHRDFYMTNNHVYSGEDIYLENLENESDEEKSWVNWAKDNRDFFETFDHIGVVKSIYKTGFANGFEFKRVINSQEQLQK
jgi:hypothetical protein